MARMIGKKGRYDIIPQTDTKAGEVEKKEPSKVTTDFKGRLASAVKTERKTNQDQPIQKKLLAPLKKLRSYFVRKSIEKEINPRAEAQNTSKAEVFPNTQTPAETITEIAKTKSQPRSASSKEDMYALTSSPKTTKSQKKQRPTEAPPEPPKTTKSQKKQRPTEAPPEPPKTESQPKADLETQNISVPIRPPRPKKEAKDSINRQNMFASTSSAKTTKSPIPPKPARLAPQPSKPESQPKADLETQNISVPVRLQIPPKPARPAPQPPKTESKRQPKPALKEQNLTASSAKETEVQNSGLKNTKTKKTKKQVNFAENENKTVEFDIRDTPSSISESVKLEAQAIDVASTQKPALKSILKSELQYVNASELQQIHTDIINHISSLLNDREMEILNDLADFLKPLPLTDQIQVLSLAALLGVSQDQTYGLDLFFEKMINNQTLWQLQNNSEIKGIIKHKFSGVDILNSLVKARAELTNSTQQGLEVLYKMVDKSDGIQLDLNTNKILIEFLSQLSQEQVNIVLSDDNSEDYPKIAELVRKYNPYEKKDNKSI